MKLFVASDLHGSEYYCKKLLEAYDREQADRFLFLGDVLYHGPRNDLPKDYNPKAVIELLNPLREKFLCVRGNCDSEVDQMVLQFPIMADYCVLEWGGTTIFATHGHIYNENNRFPIPKGSILLHGHTHVPVCNEHEDYICMNPGSVSIPKEGSAHGYMIIEGKTFVWKNLEGEITREFHLDA